MITRRAFFKGAGKVALAASFAAIGLKPDSSDRDVLLLDDPSGESTLVEVVDRYEYTQRYDGDADWYDSSNPCDEQALGKGLCPKCGTVDWMVKGHVGVYDVRATDFVTNATLTIDGVDISDTSVAVDFRDQKVLRMRKPALICDLCHDVARYETHFTSDQDVQLMVNPVLIETTMIGDQWREYQYQRKTALSKADTMLEVFSKSGTI